MDNVLSCPELETIVEAVKGRLYFAVTCSDKFQAIKNTADNFYFNVDEEFVYINYYMDFGPLNISCLYKYCQKLNSYMQCTQISRIVHYCANDMNKRVNGAYLFGSYCVVCLNMDPVCVYRKLIDGSGPFRNFLDASQGVSRYTLKLVECLQGVHKAHMLNFFDFQDFAVAEYDMYDKIQNGDFNWLVPRKFLALIGPIDKEICPNGHSPSFYIKYFLRNDVKTVIRLNNKLYNPFVFSKAGIDHYDLFFPDGTTPPKTILLKFLQIAEKTSGAIAVHCKAGLGRTGSLIGAYIMKHYQFTAKEAIAWMRICRPGSVIGQQQGWLEKIEPWLWKEGRLYRFHTYGDGDKLPRHKYGIYSKQWQIQRKKFLLFQSKRTLSEGPSLPPREQEVFRLRQFNTMFKKHSNNSGNKENNAQQKFHAQIGEKTQGDKLNEIKVKKYMSSVQNYDRCSNTTKNSNGILSDHNRHHAKMPTWMDNGNHKNGNETGAKNAQANQSDVLHRNARGRGHMKDNYYMFNGS